MTANEKPAFTIGQTLWYVQTANIRRDREPQQYEVFIKKIGRKWLEYSCNDSDGRELDFSSGRADLSTLEVDGEGYSSEGQLWLSRQAYEHEQARIKAWATLWSQIEGQYRLIPPKGLSLESIQAARAILFPAPNENSTQEPS